MIYIITNECEVPKKEREIRHEIYHFNTPKRKGKAVTKNVLGPFHLSINNVAEAELSSTN